MRHLFLLITLTCFVCNAFMVDDLHRQRDEHKLSAMPSLEGVPPEIAFATTALGAFRGILVDVLWLRASAMRDRGEFFELVQISDWIGKLEPRMPKVWGFNAWNLAYNISVELPTPAERWNWVQQGMHVLRDKGIPYNPRAAKLYEELAWIIFHKVGQFTDDHNGYYKLRMADEVDRVMGGKSATELLESDPAAAALIAAELKLDAAFMVELEKRFGSFDWRFPDAQALYWAQKGRAVSESSRIQNLDRITYSALQNCFRRGRIIIARDEAGEALATYSVPNFSFMDAVIKQFDYTIATFGATRGLLSAYEYFLKEALSMGFIYSHSTVATKALAKLREVYPDNKRYRRPLRQVAQSLLLEAIKDSERDDLHNYIMGYLTNAYVHRAWGEEMASGQMELIAFKLYDFFKKNFKSKGYQMPSFDDMRAQALRQAQRLLPPELRSKLQSSQQQSDQTE